MAKSKTLSIRLGLNSKQFEKGLKKAQRKMKTFGKSMQRVGGTITRNVTMPFAAIGAAGVKMSLDLNKSFTKIETLVGVSADQVSKMRGEVMQLSGATAKAPQELADALFTITSAGLRGAQAMEVLQMASKASAVGLGETDAIARAVTGVIASYGSENMSAAKATDTLMAIVREGNLEAESLAPVLGRVTGIAAQLGISFDEVGASIATFTRLGVSSEEAVTGLRGVMNALLKPTDQSREALASIGLTFEQLRENIQNQGLAQTLIQLTQSFDGNDEALAALIPNVRGLSAVLGTAGSQGDAYAKIQQNIANSTGILEKGFKRVSKDAGFKFNQALEKLKSVGMDIGARLIPILLKVAEYVMKGVGAFQKLSPKMKGISVGVVAIVAAAGPLLSIFGAVATAVSALISPVGLAVGAFVAGAIYVSKNWEKVRKAITNVINYFITLYNESIVFRGIIETIVFTFKTLWSAVKFFAKAGWAILKSMGQNIKNLFGGLGDIILGIFTFDTQKIKDGFESVKEGLSNSLDPNKNPDLKSAVEEHAKSTAENFETAFNNTLRGNIDLISEEDVQNAVDNVGDMVNNVKNKIASAFSGGGGGGGSAQPTTTQPAGTMGPQPFDNDSFFGDAETTEKGFFDKSKSEWATWAENGQTAIDKFASTWGAQIQGLMQTMNMFWDNQEKRLQQDTESKLFNLETQTEAERLRIENMLISEEEKNAMLEELDASHLEKKKSIEEKAGKEQRKINRKRAISERVTNAMSVISSTASAIMQAVAMFPATGGMPWSGIAAGIGAAQLGAIMAAPLPALASGGLAFGETAAIVGDNRNASVDPEVIAPLSKLQSMMGVQKIHVVGEISGENIVLSSERYKRTQSRID